MLILLGLVVLLVAGIWLRECARSWGIDALELTGLLIIAISGVVLLTAIVALPLNHVEVQAEMRAYWAVAETVRHARTADPSDTELAALQHKIIDANRWAASVKYVNGTLLGIWIPDAVEELEPLE